MLDEKTEEFYMGILIWILIGLAVYFL